jgi:hypothetical protein
MTMRWPELDYKQWEPTRDTVHMWTQIVGKTRMALSPLVNHWWNVTLYVTPQGLTTSAIPYGDKTFEAAFDFITHQLRIETSDGLKTLISLYPRSVSDFYTEYIAALHGLNIDVKLNRIPQEFHDLTPFDDDRHHASYDKDAVERFRRVLVGADRAFKIFRGRFIGKCSPVQFFWGSFDLAVTRFSGRSAPDQPAADRVTREAYSHEVISCGFWPGDRRFEHAAFYSYTAPAPTGLANESIRPVPAGWDAQLGEFIYKYVDARGLESPEEGILDFCQSTYEAGAKLGGWDRSTLERR